jgi:ATP-dependent Clp protease ATP-binding subunit ClpB
LQREGTDIRYGARPLKRAIERFLVQPISNLMATGQVHKGDRVRVTANDGSSDLTFVRETEMPQPEASRRAA